MFVGIKNDPLTHASAFISNFSQDDKEGEFCFDIIYSQDTTQTKDFEFLALLIVKGELLRSSISVDIYEKIVQIKYSYNKKYFLSKSAAKKCS